jgi:hypothetical protein
MTNRNNSARRKSVFASAALLTAAVTAILVLAFIAAGCGAGEDKAASVDVEFPEFVYRSEDSLKGYKIAVAYPEVLEFVPCYCGCEQDEKYQSLKDCFIDRKTGEYDEHAAGCGICLEEADDIGQWEKEGLSRLEIRERIDAKYEERGTPTETPMPPD